MDCATELHTTIRSDFRPLTLTRGITKTETGKFGCRLILSSQSHRREQTTSSLRPVLRSNKTIFEDAPEVAARVFLARSKLLAWEVFCHPPPAMLFSALSLAM